MFKKIEETIVKLITEAFQKASDRDLLSPVSLPSIELQIPREKDHGDLASNIAMKVASQVRRPPAETAKVIVSLIEPELNQDTEIIRIEADPRKGFINFTINPSTLHKALRGILLSPVNGALVGWGGEEGITGIHQRQPNRTPNSGPWTAGGCRRCPGQPDD